MGDSILNLYRNRGVLVSWLISYILVLLIPLSACTVVYFEAGKMITNQTNKGNAAMLTQVKQSLDSRLLDAKKLAAQITYHPNINTLNIKKNNIDQTSWVVFDKISKDLYNYTASNTFIDDLYIYIHDCNIILKPQGSTYTEILYETTHKNSILTYDEWIAFLNEKHTDTFTSISAQENSGAVNNNIAYLNSVTDLLGEPYATVVVLMKQKRFFEPLESINLENNGNVFIVNEKDTIIANTQPFHYAVSLTYADLTDDENITKYKDGNEKMIISYISSNIVGWKYVYTLPESVFWSKVQYIRNFTMVSILLSLVIGMVLAHFLAVKNYNPILNIMGMIKKNGQQEQNPVRNEFRYITEALSNTLTEKETITKKLEEQNNALRKNFLMSFIRQQTNMELPVSDMLSAYNIEFYSNNFAVMIFYIEDITKAFGGPTAKFNNDVPLIYYIVENVVEELLRQHNQGYVIEQDGMLVCLFNLKDTALENGEGELLRIAQEAKQFLEQSFQVYFTVSISNFTSSVEGIAETYKNALEAMEYRLLNRQGGIIRYSEIENVKKNKFHYFTLEKEERFINLIKVGEFEKAKSLLNEIIDRAIKQKLPISEAKCLMSNIISTIMKMMDELYVVCSSDFLDSLNYTDTLLKCATFEEMQNEILNLLIKIADYIQENKKGHNETLTDKIIAYVTENYSDINLSISAVGDKFGMNSAYLSRFFKEQTGEALLDVINSVRMKKSKELLQSTSLSIADIAVKVGFYNSAALIRAFKKYEGITPGKFREDFFRN